MSCRTLTDAVVDLARGVSIGLGTASAVRSHLEHCRACAARFARERELSESLREVAEEGQPAGVSAEVEQRLMAAFTAHHQLPETGRLLTIATSDRDSRRWLAAAAAVAIVAGGAWAIWPRGETPVQPVAPAVALRAPEQAPAPPAASADRSAELQLRGRELQLRVHGTQARAVSPRATAASRARPTPTRVSQRPSVITEFQALPGAVGLPEMESGRIVRVELAVASLAAYGVDIVPDPARPEVQADLLVGEDGLARAIRVVGVDPEPTNRQQ